MDPDAVVERHCLLYIQVVPDVIRDVGVRSPTGAFSLLQVLSVLSSNRNWKYVELPIYSAYNRIQNLL